MYRMLKFHPDDRISVEDALAHPYLKDFHGQMSEPECDRLFDFDFERRLEGEMSEEEVGPLTHRRTTRRPSSSPPPLPLLLHVHTHIYVRAYIHSRTHTCLLKPGSLANVF